ncbi:MAG: hypothetical protein FWG65_11785 [Turicibacter sp.]|nr:hypothetical protein [Turicibacter sp.]
MEEQKRYYKCGGLTSPPDLDDIILADEESTTISKQKNVIEYLINEIECRIEAGLSKADITEKKLMGIIDEQAKDDTLLDLDDDVDSETYKGYLEICRFAMQPTITKAVLAHFNVAHLSLGDA